MRHHPGGLADQLQQEHKVCAHRPPLERGVNRISQRRCVFHEACGCTSIRSRGGRNASLSKRDAKPSCCPAILLSIAYPRLELGKPSMRSAPSKFLSNNAAFQRTYDKFEDISDDEFEETLRITFLAMFLLCKASCRQLRFRGSLRGHWRSYVHVKSTRQGPATQY